MHRLIWAFGLALSASLAPLVPMVSLASLGFLVACSSEKPEEPKTDAGGEYDFEGICREGSGEVSVVGQWAGIADLQVSMLANEDALVALCPNPQIQPAELVMRIVLTEGEEGTTDVELQLCDLQLPTILVGVASCPTDPAKILELTIFPSDALSLHIPTIQINFDSGMPTAVLAGSPFEPDSFIETLGVALASPTDPLPFWDPTRAGCSPAGTSTAVDCVEGYDLLVDEDGDGQIGVTLGATSGEGALISGDAYTTIRLSPRLFGEVKNENCIDGEIALNLEFTIVSSALKVGGLALNTPMVNENIPPLDFLETSRFKLLRADGPDVPFDDDGDGVVTCAEIRNNRGNFLR